MCFLSLYSSLPLIKSPFSLPISSFCALCFPRLPLFPVTCRTIVSGFWVCHYYSSNVHTAVIYLDKYRPGWLKLSVPEVPTVVIKMLNLNQIFRFELSRCSLALCLLMNSGVLATGHTGANPSGILHQWDLSMCLLFKVCMTVLTLTKYSSFNGPL